LINTDHSKDRTPASHIALERKRGETDHSGLDAKGNTGSGVRVWIVTTCVVSGIIAAELVREGGLSSLKWIGVTAFLALLFVYCLWKENDSGKNG
jgi:hypothetical protein